MSRPLTLTVLDGLFAVHRLPPTAEIPGDCFSGVFSSVTRTADELSLVCPEGVVIEGSEVERGWACIRVAGPLDLGLAGVLAGIAGALSGAGVALFAVSTHDTDYVLVKHDCLPEARRALEGGGYHFG